MIKSLGLRGAQPQTLIEAIVAIDTIVAIENYIFCKVLKFLGGIFVFALCVFVSLRLTKADV